ncbi:MAG: ISAs1 family transposase [Oligoflexia bacterium]|nr:ISAs1 family transposase [Oligoflexia bacterium]
MRSPFSKNIFSELDDEIVWMDFKSVTAVHSTREIKRQCQSEIRYFISSLKNDAAKIGKYIREHWHIENKLHWSLDISFREDHSRIRKIYSAQNLSLIRKIAFNILKNDSSKMSTSRKRLKALTRKDYLEEILFS